ncbi:hypothetical protein D9757_004857 [Collybiopsis confluens]|uniref:Transcription elongation factor SPT5 n=1 Tax=Collybiopsis confluens TaxID=2823264 RepID=A0A8H5HSK7_9AGAR|nr:hypothetical protein D9757_004857 [Collybiopsis confluens]
MSLSRTEFDDSLKSILDAPYLIQLHNTLIISLFDARSHKRPLTPPPAEQKAKPPRPRKRRRVLPYQGPDVPDEQLGLISTRLKRWVVSLGKAERERIRNFSAEPQPLDQLQLKDLREITEEIQRERPLSLPKERDDPPGTRLTVSLSTTTRAPTVQHIAERINLVKLKQLITHALTLTASSLAISSISTSTSSSNSAHQSHQRVLSTAALETLFTLSPADLPNKSAAAMKLAVLGDVDRDEEAEDGISSLLPRGNGQSRNHEPRWQIAALLAQRSAVKEILLDSKDHHEDEVFGEASDYAPPRRQLYDDEEDEEEDEEEAEEERAGSKKDKKRAKHRHKKDPLARFIDLEAEVSDDEEEEDEDEEFANDGFIETGAGADAEDDGRHHARLNKRRQLEAEDERSPEQIAREYRERYNTRNPSRFTGDMNEIPQRLLMPSVHDASLWQVRVKAGREREIVFSLMRKSIDLEYTAKPLSIISAFQRDSLPGMIYVEARSSQQVQMACNGLVGVYLSRGVHLVPIDEMASLLMIKKQDLNVTPGSWVRLRRGKYQGDLAQVVDITENGDEIGLKFVPRIDLNPRDDNDGGKKRKKGSTMTAGNTNSRPPQRLFNYEEVIKVYGRNTVTKRGAVFVFQQDTYKDGFVEKDVKLNSIVLEDVNPTLDEITMFSRSQDGSSTLEEGIVDLSIIAEASRKAALAVLQPGDHVEVFEGEQAGVHGVVEEISGDVLTITAEALEGEGERRMKIDLPARSVRKRFKPGDHVKVMSGKNAGETGLVVAVTENKVTGTGAGANSSVVTFLSDMSMQEVSVFSKDLREAAEVGNTTNVVGDYELHDLVQLDQQTVGVIYKTERDSFRVLDQSAQTRLVHPHQISMRKDSSRAIATDSEGHELRIGDMMKESEGEGRKGRVLHIHQSHFAFLHNREIIENGGVFVTRARGLVSVAPKGSLMKLGPNADLTKMNPAAAGGAQGVGAGGGMVGSGAMGRGPRDRLIGVHVVVIKGPHKGYVGIVKDTNGGVARVELNTGNKMISIDKTKIHRKLPNGKTEPVEGPGATWGRNNRNNSMGPPSFTNRTPNPYANGGGRTPAFGAGGRTPAWGGGGGGRTPNPYASNGGQTPAWNSSSRTPNPYANSGGQTPAWNAGSKTPNPYASGGSAERDKGGWGGATPAWNSSSRTPNPYASSSGSSGWDRDPDDHTTMGNGSNGGWGGATPALPVWGGRDPDDHTPMGNGRSAGWTPAQVVFERDPDDHTITGNGKSSTFPEGWVATPTGIWSAPTPAYAATPAFMPTPGLPGLSTPQYGIALNPYISTPGFMPSTPGGLMGVYETEREVFAWSPTWLLDDFLAPYLTKLRVEIRGSRRDNYLDGKYDFQEAHILAASRVAGNFEQTALLKIELHPTGTEERSFLMKYITPVVPQRQDEPAIVLTGPKQGEKVKMRQRPDISTMTELIVVETDNDSSDAGVYWECQKDHMCALWTKD